VNYTFSKCDVNRWAGVVLHTWPRFSRPLRILSLMMNILVMLFLEALTYDLSDPDDGSCSHQQTVADCYKQKSSLAKGETMCYWDSEKETCYFREISGEFYRMAAVAIIAAVVGTPFALAIEALISNVLAAQTISAKDKNKSARSSMSNGRGSSSVVQSVCALNTSNGSTEIVMHSPPGVSSSVSSSALEDRKRDENVRKSYIMLRKAEEALRSSVEDDYKAMQSELGPYRERLKPAERKEFDRK
jgi:hypothetical protein